MSNAIDDVIRERRHQLEDEGFDAAHDDCLAAGMLANAGSGYAIHAAYTLKNGASPTRQPPPDWPWHESWWNPTTPRRDLVKAAALIIAEIDRLDRHP